MEVVYIRKKEENKEFKHELMSVSITQRKY